MIHCDTKPRYCRGVIRRTGLPCKNAPKDINSFCDQHRSQSIDYAKNTKAIQHIKSTKIGNAEIAETVYTTESYIINIGDEMKGKITLPIEKGGYTHGEIKRKWLNKISNLKGKRITLHIDVCEIELITIKTRTCELVKTIVEECCRWKGLTGDYCLRHQHTLLPKDGLIGFFVDDGDTLKIVA